MSKESTQEVVTEQGLDPQSQAYVDQMRQHARGGAGVALNTPGNFFLGPDTRSIQDQIAPFLNPYMDQVIGGVRDEFDNLRGQAQVGVNQGATAAGAFGGSRQGVAQGTRLGEIDRAQTSQIGGLLSSGFQNALTQGLQFSEYQRALRERQAQEPLFRQQQAQQMLNLGLGPTGFTNTNTQTHRGSTLGTITGLAGTVGGAIIGGPGGAAVGSQLGGSPSFQPVPFNQPPLFPGSQGNPLTGFGRVG